ncbi:MAG: ATP-binding protein [Pirellulales bacterium]
MHQPTPDERKAAEQERAAKAYLQEQARRRNAWESLARKLGSRYAGCSLDGFHISEDPTIAARQTAVLAALRDYAGHLERRVDDGRGLILFGPSGTGKDHLLAALAREAVLGFGLEVMWRNGLDIWSDLRDSIGSDHATSERTLRDRLARPQVLWISDPLPPAGPLTDFQKQFLFRLVDVRYRDCKPHWVSLNVAGAEEASDRLGANIVDRLRDDALALHANWPSYRKARV